MLILLRPAAVLLLAVLVAAAPSAVLLGASLVPMIIVQLRGRESLRALGARNLPILLFSLVFTALTVVPGEGPLSSKGGEAAMTVLKIAGVYNVVFTGGRWTGRRRFAGVVGHIPIERLRVYLVLLQAVTERLLRNSTQIVRQISLRLSTSGAGRLAVARYYFQNMASKELASMRHLQAAAILRLHGVPGSSAEKPRPRGEELAAFFYALALWAFYLYGIIA